MKETAILGNSSPNPISWLGRSTLKLVYSVGHYANFAFSVYHRCLTPPWRWRMILEQAKVVGVKSFPIAALTSVFVGMVMVLQTGVQLTKFGAKNYVPGISFIANVREMVPAFCSIVVGARVAASITAEIGTMRVTEQIDAMDVLNVDPVRYLTAPRVIAMTLMLPCICTICIVTGYLGGMFVANAALSIEPLAYFETTRAFAAQSDVVGGIIKTIFFGNLIALTGCYFGFNTEGGASGVGRATTNSVVLTLILILIFDYVLTSLILALVGADT